MSGPLVTSLPACVAVPLDRDSTFDPLIVRKHQRRLNGVMDVTMIKVRDGHAPTRVHSRDGTPWPLRDTAPRRRRPQRRSSSSVSIWIPCASARHDGDPAGLLRLPKDLSLRACPAAPKTDRLRHDLAMNWARAHRPHAGDAPFDATGAISPAAAPALSNRAVARALGSATRRDTPPVKTLAKAFGLTSQSATVYSSENSDVIPRFFAAPAVSFDATVVIDSHSYAPHRRAGRELIAHELAHIALGHTVRAGVRRSDPTQDVVAEQAVEIEITEAADRLMANEISRALEASNYDTIVEKKGTIELYGTDWDFWSEAEEDATIRSYHFRRYRLMLQALKDVWDLEDAQAAVNEAKEIAESEAETLSELGPGLAESDAWAFPETWAARVEEELKPPPDLALEEARSSFEVEGNELSKRCREIADDVLRRGLPVGLDEALRLTSFHFSDSLADDAPNHAVGAFALQARRWAPAFVHLRVAQGWQHGKDALVAAVRAGEKVVNVSKWEDIQLAPAADLDRLASEALTEGVQPFDVMDSDLVDTWRYELALAYLAASFRMWHMLPALWLLDERFDGAMVEADRRVEATNEEARVDLARAWGEAEGYDSAALAVVTQALADNAGQVALDMTKDAAIAAVPYIGAIWAVKGFFEEARDLYDAYASLEAARESARSATTAVALQRAAAHMSTAKISSAATVAMTALSEGISFGAGKIAKRRRGSTAHHAGEPLSGEPAAHPTGLHEPDLHEPDLHEPDLHEPDLHEPDLHEPDLHEPDLHEPDLHEPDLHEPPLTLDGVVRALKSKGLTREDLHLFKGTRQNLSAPLARRVARLTKHYNPDEVKAFGEFLSRHKTYLTDKAVEELVKQVPKGGLRERIALLEEIMFKIEELSGIHSEQELAATEGITIDSVERKPPRVDANGLEAPLVDVVEAPGSRALRKSLVARDGELPAPGYHAHHIVPEKDFSPGLDWLREALAQAGCGINEAGNGVFLAGSRVTANPELTRLHLSYIHAGTRKEYAYTLTRRLYGKSGAALLKEIETIGHEMRAGDFEILSIPHGWKGKWEPGMTAPEDAVQKPEWIE